MRYLSAASVPEGQPVPPLSAGELPRLREAGHATYWDTSKGPPGVSACFLAFAVLHATTTLLLHLAVFAV